MAPGPRSAAVANEPVPRTRLFLLKLLSRLPLPILYLFSPLVYVVTYYLLGHRKHILFDNLRQCFPEKSEAEIVALAKRNFRNFSDVLIEVLKGISMSDAEFLRRVEFRNLELLTDYARERKPMVLLAAHHCNWEWLLLGACLRVPFPLDVVYKPLDNDLFEALMLHARERFGGNLIAPENFIAEIIKRRGQAVGFVMNADQTPLREEEKYWSRFMNRDTAFFLGADKIARMTRAPVFFVAMRRVARGRYEAEVSELARPPFESGHAVVERYVRALEELVRQSPEDWLWIYNKWKYKKPLYGNVG
jgi:KDO2-lipid IV(A) lauroyltransferase